MAYLSKECILNAYRVIKRSCPTADISNFSSLQYFIAADRFYRCNNNNPCDSSLSSNKNLFISYVKDVIELDDGHYFKSLKEIYEGAKSINGTVSSNFFSGSSVQDSGRTSGVKYPYPAKTGQSLIYAEDKKIFVSDDYYPNLGKYLNASEKVALAIWLLRKVDKFAGFSLGELRNILGDFYTQKMVDSLLNCSQEEWVNINNSLMIKGVDEIAIIMMEDIIGKQNNDIVVIPPSYQQIFYGAPGTGKSNTIKRDVDDKGKANFRVTFHPDSDYSTFVGAYKPTMSKKDKSAKSVILDYDSLVDKLKEYLDSSKDNLTRAFTLFGNDYHDSLIKMQSNANHTVRSLVVDAYKSGTTYDTQVRVGMNVYESNAKENRECSQIIYTFVPQAFTKAYTAAWNTEDDVYLIIEEINRGNCAQIFGDLFQLLDRNDRGFSEYPVDADTDLADFICKELKDSQRDFPEGVKEGKKLVLPSNLYIWATMNTSDQSLFPIDSAFKRRWEWKYVKIAEGRDSETKELLNWVVKFDYVEDDKPYTFECSWWEFVKAINEKIAAATSSDDKKLGYFFCKPKTQDSKVIDAERFVGKVVFYLWNDVFKDEENAIFKVVDGKGDPSFDAFYTEDDKGKTIADTKSLRAFMHNVFGDQSELYTETAKDSIESTETE
jgi:hypothetical protein